MNIGVILDFLIRNLFYREARSRHTEIISTIMILIRMYGFKKIHIIAMKVARQILEILITIHKQIESLLAINSRIGAVRDRRFQHMFATKGGRTCVPIGDTNVNSTMN